MYLYQCIVFCFQCTDFSPCFNGRCINESPGYQCLACPYGYTGFLKDGRSADLDNRIFLCGGDDDTITNTTVVEQICEDIDECATDNGNCDINAYCFNAMVTWSIFITPNIHFKHGCSISIEHRISALTVSLSFKNACFILSVLLSE